ncbi:hypothetical protein OAO87_02525 [bacterium]|nr:hypothetical protein [bacterium]
MARRLSTTHLENEPDGDARDAEPPRCCAPAQAARGVDAGGVTSKPPRRAATGLARAAEKGEEGSAGSGNGPEHTQGRGVRARTRRQRLFPPPAPGAWTTPHGRRLALALSRRRLRVSRRCRRQAKRSSRAATTSCSVLSTVGLPRVDVLYRQKAGLVSNVSGPNLALSSKHQRLVSKGRGLTVYQEARWRAPAHAIPTENANALHAMP